MTKFETILEACALMRVLSPKRFAKDLYELPNEEWDTATEEAIMLVTERNPPGDRIDMSRNRAIRKRKMDSMCWLASDKAEDALQNLVHSIGAFSNGNLPKMRELTEDLDIDIENLRHSLRDLGLYAKKLNAVYNTIVSLIKSVNDLPMKETSPEEQFLKPHDQKIVKDKLKELEIYVNHDRVWKPEDLEEQALEYYKIVHPEMYHSWRGTFAGEKFNF
jgi:FMN phosphatase YigB (HAD superfamily)